MGEFIEERLDPCIRLGAETEDGFFLEVTRTANGARYAALKNGKPWRTFDIEYVKDDKDLALQVASLYYRTWGGYAGFRVQAWDDFTTALDGVSAYMATDCVLDVVSPGIYQLVKEYGRDKPALPSIGRPRRTIFKPVQGEVAIAIAQIDYPNGYTVDTTTGRVSLAANKTGVITGIAKGSSTVISVLNSLLVGESVVFRDILGTVQLNGQRGRVIASSPTAITVAINSSTFGDYISGGTVQTRPLDTGTDILTGGCKFDYPVVFASRFNVQALGMDIGQASGLTLEEVLNP